ncbi:MAG TPA: hypothetical protein VK139_07250 [Microbacteriaceae bacterium]|nr:hypothetical protein [Microbacteriaceae bacterium]
MKFNKFAIASVGSALVVASVVSPAFAAVSTVNLAGRSGDSAFVRNSWVQAGLKADGTFGSNENDSLPSNFESTTVDGPTGALGLIADGNEDGTFEQGDFFLPGSPYESWSVKVGDGTPTDADAPPVGSWVSSETDGDASVTWESTSDVDGIGITQNVSAPVAGDHLFHVKVTLQNNSGSSKTVYYMRQVDPDNAVDPMLRDDPDGETDYSTFNTVVANSSTSQIVTGTTYYNFSTIGYRAADPDAVVRISDWSNPLEGEDADGNEIVLTASELDAKYEAMRAEYKAGYQDYTDNTIDIAFRKVIAAGASATIDFDYILSPTLADLPAYALDLSLDLSVGGAYADAATALAGGGLMPNSEYTLTEHSTPREIFTGTTLPNGNFYDETALPTDCRPGSHTLILTGTSPAGTPVSDWVTYTVDDTCTVTAFDPYAKANGAPNPDAPAAPAALASTGSNVSAAISVIAMFATLGVAAFMMAGRRRRATL